MPTAPVDSPDTPGAPGPARLGALGIVTLLVAAAIFGGVTLLSPFGRDQGNYAYSAWEWLHGRMLYSGVFVFKPPMTSLVHAFAQVLFGASMTSIRVLDVGWTALTALVTARCSAHLFRHRLSALAAGLLVPAFQFLPGWWGTAQTDGWMGLPCLLALLLILEGGGGTARSVAYLAGTLVGVAMLFKYVAAAFVLGLIVASFPVRSSGPRSVLLTLGVGALGLMTPLMLCAAWLATNGAMDAFLDCQFSLVPGYVTGTGRPGLAYGMSSLLRWLTGDPRFHCVVIALPGLILAVARLARGHRGCGVALAWLGAGLASYLSQGKYFDYHLLALVPGLALVGGLGIGWGLDHVYTFIPTPSLQRGLTLGLLLLAPGLTPYPRSFGIAAQILRGDRTLEEYWHTDPAFVLPDYALPEVLGVARWLREHTGPEDRVFVWGFEPTIQFVAQRDTVSRFLYNYPFAAVWAGEARYGAELLAELRASPPRYIVVGSRDATPYVTGNRLDSRALFLAFEELRLFVEDGYQPAGRLGRYTFFQPTPSP